MRGRCIVVCLAAAVACCSLAAPAAADMQPYRTGDYLGFQDVLPPGTNGRASLLELASFLATGARPRHNDDQLGMYERLLSATPGVTATTLGLLFKDSSFGVAPGDQARVYSPGQPRGPDDRARHVVRRPARLRRRRAPPRCSGSATSPRRTGSSSWTCCATPAAASSAGSPAAPPATARWTPTSGARRPTPRPTCSARPTSSTTSTATRAASCRPTRSEYVAGVNQYISEARLDVTKMPGEYAAIGKPLEDWKVTDIIATASLVGGIFGKGGGDELTQMELRRSFVARYGSRRGAGAVARVGRLRGRRRADDRARQALPVPDGAALAGPRRRRDRRRGLAAPGDARRRRDRSRRRRPAVRRHAARRPAERPAAAGRLVEQRASSNALVVSGAESASGHPVAVFGPQVAYFSPQILMEQDVHAPGIDARGASFPGVNLYVQLGRGPDYAWSATSAGQDIIDTFALELCEPDGRAPTIDSAHYRYRGACLPIEVLEHTNSWTPTLGDATPAGSVTLRALRTKLGIVSARATIKGKPVVYTRLRSTYMHEIDSARGFSDLNDPAIVRDAAGFQRAAHKIGYTFNWLYADDRDIAYFNSGDNPQRAAGVTGQLPMPAKHEWRGYRPRPRDGRVHVVRQAPAHDQRPAVHHVVEQQAGARLRGRRLEPLLVGLPLADARPGDRGADRRARARSRSPGLVEAMGEAATTDLRAEQVLPLALDVIGSPRDDKLADAVALLRDWVASGSHRRDRNGDGRYEHAEAIRILDAFWPGWMRAQFEPSLGSKLFDQLVDAHELDNAPNNDGSHLGSAYQGGWYGYAAKDLRRVLGRKRQGAVLQALLRRPARGRAAGRACATRCRGRSTCPRPSSTPTRRARTPARRTTRLLRQDRLPLDGRGHAADDRLAEPAHLPAGRRDPRPPAALRPRRVTGARRGSSRPGGEEPPRWLPGSRRAPSTSPPATTRASAATSAACSSCSSRRASASARCSRRCPARSASCCTRARSSSTSPSRCLPIVRRMTTPAARRYLAGWAGRGALHVLAPARHARARRERRRLARDAPADARRRSTSSSSSRSATPSCRRRGARAARGARRAGHGSSPGRRSGSRARRRSRGPRSRAACARTRDPEFPPGLRDAALLGGSLVDLVAREQGMAGVVKLACSPLPPGGPRQALLEAFDGRALVHTEGTWRAHLSRLAGQ